METRIKPSQMSFLILVMLIILVGSISFPAHAEMLTESPGSAAADVTISGTYNSASIQVVLDAFTSLTGYTAQYTQMRNYEDYLYCTASQTCPDIAIPPWPGLLAELGRAV